MPSTGEYVLPGEQADEGDVQVIEAQRQRGAPTDANAGAEHGFGVLGGDRLPAQAQMIGQPEIVVVQVGDVVAAAEFEADVVRP